MCRIIKILPIIFLLGFFLVPAEVSACTSHTKESFKKEKSCCDHHSSDRESKHACKKDCCKDSAGDSGCSGNCGAKSCQTSAQSFWVHQIFGGSYHAFEYETKNSYYFYKQPYYSSGFHSIWQPPKIA